ncbi:hypothetical protein C8F01DRAFT_1170541 [Mycena amicta]|nr:hypothetical protein C8F01DRAFT_1170541 [Mycena amicta]
MLRCWRRPAGPVLNLFRLYSTPANPLASLSALHAFLAPSNIASKQPAITYAAKDLHKLYLDVRSLPSRSKGHPLNTYELNELLGLFGTLSIRIPRPKCIYLHPFASHIHPSPFRTYWSLVLQLAEEIRVRKHRKARTGTHHYWVMRAVLARARASPEDKGDLVDEATSRYLRIRNTPDPEVHITYLGVMLSLRRRTHLDQTVRFLCRVLCRHPFPDLLGDSSLLNAKIQDNILIMLSTRLETFPPSSDPPSRPESQITLSQLAGALAMQIFPCYRVGLPNVVSEWATTAARAAFHPQESVASRWVSLSLLALYVGPNTLHGTFGKSSMAKSHPPWNIVLALATLERSIQPNHAIRNAVMAAFFRLAGKTRDRRLVDVCRQYCISQELWHADAVQATLLTDYAHAALYTRSGGWDELFDTIPSEMYPTVADGLLRSLLPLDAAAGQTLYAFCQRKNISISAHSVYILGVTLAQMYFPSQALAFLRDERLSLDQLEDLFNRILAHTFRDGPLAAALFPILKRLYIDTDRKPAERVKFSIRYALSILADSNFPAQSAALLRVLHKRQPTFFSSHYFLRIMRTLVRRRRLAAVSLLEPMQSFPPLARQNFRRKLALRLAQTGAHTLAQYTYRFGGMKAQRRTAREVLASAVRFRVNYRDGRPLRRSAGKIMAVVARRPKDIPTVKFGVALLSRIGRIRDAKRVLADARAAGVDSTAITWLGNAILNGALHRSKNKHARLVRHVLNNREQLQQRVGFSPDRVTVNILVKVLLRWTGYMTAPRVRRLFDHMIRIGYPAPAGWRTRGGVPFATKNTMGLGSDAITALKLPPFISFERHVRPLYKMFIKALHLQGDRQGAGKVVGILRAVEEEVLARRQVRRRERRYGHVLRVE